MLKDKTIPLYFILFFAILTVIYYPTFFNAPRSDWWESLYFFHTIYANSNPLQLLHILNTDCVQHTSFRPLSHFILYIQHFIFGSNFFYIHVINFVLYCLSLLLLYRLAAVFINNKFLGAVFISYFAFLYSHFDIVSWTAHSYIILGFCFFLLGLILYTKFLKTGSLGSLFLIGILFLSGMFCYEALILWPLSIVILAHIGNLINREKVTKTKLVLSYLLVLALIYIVYMCIFLLIRNIKTYSDSDSRRYALLLQSISIIRIYRTTLAVLFNILYNGLIVNIIPILAYPAWIAPTSFNIQLGGFLRAYRPGIIHMQVAAVILLSISGWIIFYLFRHKKSNIIKTLIFFAFLLFSFAFIVFSSKYFTNKVYSYSFYQFRHQYIPNAFIVLMAVLFFDNLIIARRRTKIIIYAVLPILILLNIYCAVSSISLERQQLAPLNRILANIKSGIRTGQINENNKLYIDDRVVDVLPPMCWNPVIAKFMERTYQWAFSRKEIKYFSNTLNDAVWSIDAKNFSLIRRYPEATPGEVKEISLKPEKPLGSSILYGDYVELGNFYKNRGKNKEAEEMFIKALEINPESNEARIYLGELYIRQGKYPEAEKMFRRLVEINPENENGYISLGNLYRLQSNYPQAEKMYKKLLEINPENDIAIAGLGHLYNTQKKYQEAEKMFKKAIALNPGNASAYDGLGALYIDQKKYQEAEEMFKNALRIAPNNDVFFADLGHLYNAQKKYPEAEAMFKNALRINPNNREVYNVLQDCYKRQGKK